MQTATAPRPWPDGSRVLFEREGALVAVHRASGVEETLVPRETTGWIGFPLHPAVAPDGARLAYAKSRLGPLGQVVLVDLASGEERVLVEERARHADLSFTPDGAGLLLSSGRAGALNLWWVDVATGARERLTTGAGDDFAPTASAGRVAYQIRRDDWELVRFDPVSGALEVLFQARAPLQGVQLSPSGDRALVVVTTGEGVELMAIGAASGDVGRVPRASDGMRLFGRWIDTSRILCYRDLGSRSDLVTIDERSGAEEVLVPDWSVQDHPFAPPSPGGVWLSVFALGARQPWTLVMPLGGDVGDATQHACFNARWHPTEARIVGEAFAGGFLVADARGGGGAPRMMPAIGRGPAFTRDGGALVAVRDGADGRASLIRVDLGTNETEVLLEDVGGTVDETNALDADPEGRVWFVRFVPRSSEAWVLEAPPGGV